MKHEPIVIEETINAPVEKVWQAITDKNKMKQWYFDLKEFSPAVGFEFSFIGTGRQGDKYMHRCKVTEAVENKKLQYSWQYENLNGYSLVTFELFREGKQTRVKLTHEGLETFPQNNPDFAAESFAGGWTQIISKLDHYMNTQINIRKKLKRKNTSRVCTYLNFPGTTEAAFLFYKQVFGTEFHGGGIQRFGDTALPEGTPPLSEEDKRLIIHVELPILGGHILMATDAPESMGFKLAYGNNMHINLEPDTKLETKRLFDALSTGGQVTMELKDMFWGAYFGSCTDKFGINWMFNYSTKLINK